MVSNHGKRVQSNGTDQAMRATLPCAMCQGSTRIRSNRPMSDISRELYLQCTNIECGATFRATLAYLNICSVGALPAEERPRVPLAIAPVRRRAANDDHARGPGVPPHANDDDAMSEAN